MAASGYTPIQLYRSATASAAPLAANLSSGELALNYNSADMTLYAKNSGGTVKRIMNNPSGLKYPVFDGTPGAVLMTDGSGNLEFNLNQNAIINSLTVGGNTNGSIIFGIDALYTNPSAVNIAALGSNALYLNSSGADNIAVGYSALYNNTTGSNNIGIGSNALITNSTGSDNVVLGYNAGYSATGSGNVALGSSSLYANTGSHNIGIGESTLYASGTGSSNIAIGRNVLTALFDASYNVGIGDYALYKATSNAGNVAIGQNALYEASSGVATFTIYNAGSGYTDGYYPNSTLTYLSGPTFATAPTANILVSGGHVVSVTLVTFGTGFKGTSTQLSAALSGGSGFGIVVTALISASNNVGIGSNTLYNNKWGETNVAIGKQALYTNNNGDLNIAIGYQAMYLNTTGSQNVALGSSALYSNTTGFYNTAIGNLAAYFNTTGQHNVAIGLEALRYNSTGSHNIALGYHALYNTTGSNNIAIGNNVGADVTTGSGNVLIGDFLPASPYASSSGNIAISNGSSNVAAIVYDSGLDLWYIRNNTTVVPPLTIDSSGNVGIGTLAPSGAFGGPVLAIYSPSSQPRIALKNAVSGNAGGDGFQIGLSGDTPPIAFLENREDGPMTFSTNGTERMRIDSSGNLGLGVTPSAWASIFKTLDVNTTGAFGATSGGTYALYNFYFDSAITPRYKTSGSALYYGVEYHRHVWYTAPSGTAGDAISFTQAMTLDASGNLGIGTSIPTVKLDIGGSTALAIQASLTTGTTDPNFHLYAVNGATGSAAGTEVARFGVGYDGNASTSFSSGFSFIRGAGATDGSLAILTSASERMRIDASGNVGIGTASPTTKLDVNGGIKTNTGVVTSGNGLGGPYYLDGYDAPLVAEALDDGAYSAIFTNNSAGSYYGFGVYVTNDGQSRIYGGDGSGGVMGLLGYDPVGGMTQLGTGIYLNNLNGYVGIDTNAPAAKLDVSGGHLRLGDDWSLYWGDGSSSINGNSTSDFVKIATNSTERMRINSSGNVGIGTSIPTYKLQLSTDSAAKPSTNTWTIASDERIKNVTGEYTKGLDAVCALRPITYEYNGAAGFEADGKENISIIAQEAIEHFPECVGTFNAKLNETDETETELYNWNGHALTFALVNAIKELKAELDALKAELQALKGN